MSRRTDIHSLFLLQSSGKFDSVAPARRQPGLSLTVFAFHVIAGTIPELTTQKGICMKSAIVVKVAAAAVVAVLAGCTDLKPLQAQVDDLKGQVSRLQSDLASAKTSAESANSTAQSANQAASGAQSTANQALAAAQASQSCCDSTNEKIDRMFRRSVSK
jgi:hypothetical protein